MIPPRLRKGDTIGFVCPSHPIDFVPGAQPADKDKRSLFKNAAAYLRRQGFQVKFSKNAFAVDEYGFSAGTPQERAEDINAMFADKTVKAIWCTQGGGTANTTLDHLDWDLIKKNPKIITGLSDITVLLDAIHRKTGLVTFHFTDPKIGDKGIHFDHPYSQQEFAARFVQGIMGEVPPLKPRKCVRKGYAKGRLIGGNLKCLLKLAGTPYFPDLRGALLFIEGYCETIEESEYRVTQLKQTGAFEKIKGVIIGYYYAFEKEVQKDKNGKRIFFEDIFLKYAQGHDFPILKTSDFGHKCPSAVLPIGTLGEMDAGKKTITLMETCVR